MRDDGDSNQISSSGKHGKMWIYSRYTLRVELLWFPYQLGIGSEETNLGCQ